MAGFSTPEVARAARLTPRQVSYWASTNLYRASLRETTGKGVHRRYDLRDVRALAALGVMRRRGCSLPALRRVSAWLEHHNLTLRDNAGLLVYVEGAKRDVLLARSPVEVVSLLTAPGQMVVPVVVDLAELFHEVGARIVDIEEARQRRAARKPKRRRRRKAKRAAKESTRTKRGGGESRGRLGHKEKARQVLEHLAGPWSTEVECHQPRIQGPQYRPL